MKRIVFIGTLLLVFVLTAGTASAQSSGGPFLPPPPAATLVSPNGTITTATPTYIWNAVSSSTWYYLSVNDSTGNRIQQWYTASAAGCPSGTGTCSAAPGVALAAGASSWKVQTWSSAGYGLWSTPMSFNVDIPVPPPAATLVSPSGTITTATPTYTWNAVSTATDYYLWVSDSSGVKIQTWYTAAQAGCGSGTGNCSVTPATALATGSGAWYIQTKNSAGSGPWSSGMFFTIQIPLTAATPLIPAEGSTITAATPTYTWTAAPAATWYYLSVDDPTGNKILQWYTSSAAGCASGTGNCSVTPATVLSSGGCKWKVETWNSSSGFGPWSTQVSFTVNAPGPPVAPNLISPSGTIAATTLTYIWNAVSTASDYYLWVSDSSGAKIQTWYTAAQAGCGSGTGNCSVTPATPLNIGGGQWWVQAKNSAGTSSWSAPLSFTVTLSRAGSPQFRAIGGVSMGAYGAMNIGLGRPGFFNTIASLGGPLDMAYLLKFIEVDMLGNYDNPSAYPNRDTLLNMLKDLTISFGNPVYYNPLSTYYPPGITAQNARIPTTFLNFKDGELNPNGSRPVITYEDPGPGDWVEVLLALDSNGNGKRDLGEPILRQFQEPFIDKNGNEMFDPGEPFSDSGLDGVWGTGDYGEGDGEFTYNPNHDNFMAEDPLTRANTLPLATLQNLNLYIDAGTRDEFQFNINAENFVQTLFGRSLNFRVENGFPENFPRVSHFNEKRVYVRYPGGHVGFEKENIGLSFEQAKQGIEEAIVVANRFTTLFSFISDHFTGGDFGTSPLELLLYPSKMEVAYFTSSSLNRTMRFGIYLPPGYSRSKTNYYPVLYLLLGYNMSVDGMTNSWIKTVLDGFILTGEMQKMIIVIPDGLNYKNHRGHFFVNQIDRERGDNFKDYFFDLVTFIDTYYKTK